MLDSAIQAHRLWKEKLRQAINQGHLEGYTKATVSSSHHCELGKNILDATMIPPALKETAEFKKVLEIHATFHTVAGEIFTLATAGKKEEATAMLAGEKFMKTSMDTLQALRALCTKAQSMGI
jgi:hypothetical protein